MQQRIPELRRLRGQILETFGDSADAAAAAGATDLWLYCWEPTSASPWNEVTWPAPRN